MSEDRLKILVFIDHDIMIRHFVRSGVFQETIARHDVVWVFPEEGNRRIHTDLATIPLGAPVRRIKLNPVRQSIWSWWFHAETMRWRLGKDAAAFRRHRAINRTKADNRRFGLRGLPLVFSLYSLGCRWRLARQPEAELENLLDAEKPDLIVHPTVLHGLFLNELIYHGRKRKIPVVAIMNSWDNPSTKRAMIGTPDWLLVWGPQTRNHAVRYVGMRRDRAVIFGAAQFDIYRTPPEIDRETFRRTYEVPVGNRILVYAGSSKETDEFAHLKAIDEAIERGEIANVSVVYRPHPWGLGGRDGTRIAAEPWRHIRFDVSMVDYLQGLNDPTRKRLPDADYRHTRDLLANVDAVVSPLSTIVLEAALFGVPSMCFLPVDDTQAQHFHMNVDLTHFRDLYEMPEFVVSRGTESLLPGVKELLSRVGDPAFALRLSRAADHFVHRFDRPYGERLADFLAERGRESRR